MTQSGKGKEENQNHYKVENYNRGFKNKHKQNQTLLEKQKNTLKKTQFRHIIVGKNPEIKSEIWGKTIWYLSNLLF